MIPDSAISYTIFEIQKMLNAVCQAYPQRNNAEDGLSKVPNEISPAVFASSGITNIHHNPILGNQQTDVTQLQFPDQSASAFEFENFTFDPASIDWEIDVFASEFTDNVVQAEAAGFYYPGLTGNV